VCGGYKKKDRTLLNSLENLVFILVRNILKFLLSPLKNKQEAKESRGFIPPLLCKTNKSLLFLNSLSNFRRKDHNIIARSIKCSLSSTQKSILLEKIAARRELYRCCFLLPVLLIHGHQGLFLVNCKVYGQVNPAAEYIYSKCF